LFDALSLTSFQACRRRALLYRDWLPYRYRPKTLFDSCLRYAVRTLSSTDPPPPQNVAASARASFFARTARPGLDLPGKEVYAAAKEWSAILDTVILSIARLRLLVLHPLDDLRVSDGLSWRFLALGQDDSGMLHRWITVNRWDDNAFRREMHGWPVMGDIAMAQAPLNLHVVVLGSMRDGHHHSPWGRRFRHNTMPSLHPHFRSPNGEPLKGWRPEYLAELAGTDANPDAWVDQMWKEGAGAGLLHHPVIDCPGSSAIDDIQRQIEAEAFEFERRSAEVPPYGEGWQASAMSRGACDWVGGRCAFQACCHTERAIGAGEMEEIGYVQRSEIKSINRDPIMRIPESQGQDQGSLESRPKPPGLPRRYKPAASPGTGSEERPLAPDAARPSS
jgi:hypothetical protein